MYVIRNYTGNFGGSMYGLLYTLADARDKGSNMSYYITHRLVDFESKFGDLGSSSLDEVTDFLSGCSNAFSNLLRNMLNATCNLLRSMLDGAPDFLESLLYFGANPATYKLIVHVSRNAEVSGGNGGC